MPKFCPQIRVIRRTKEIGSDRFGIEPIEMIANIEKIIAQTPDAVSVRLLSFHAQNQAYCREYKNKTANKRYCMDIVSGNYLHFHIFKDSQIERRDCIIALLPKSKQESELSTIIDELSKIIQWLEISRKINLVIFRFGPPIHGTDDNRHWQDKLQNFIRQMNDTHFVVPQIKSIQEKISDKKSLVINDNIVNAITIS